MTAGRPSAYDPDFCERVIELGRGQSKVQMASEFDVSRQTIDNWADANPEFLEALNRAMAHCQAWWEAQGQSGPSPRLQRRSLEEVDGGARDDYTGARSDWRERPAGTLHHRAQDVDPRGGSRKLKPCQPARTKAHMEGEGAKSTSSPVILRCYERMTRVVCIREVQNSIKDWFASFCRQISKFGLEEAFEDWSEIRCPRTVR